MKIRRLSSRSFHKIKVPQRFINHPPKPEKIIDKMLRFNRESELDDIIVDDKMNIMDGYCSYLIAQQVGVDFVTIKQVRCR